jgi:sucrose phosphorylase
MKNQVQLIAYVDRQGDWVYDFALPPLVLHALFRSDPGPLARWLSVSPRNAMTVLDTHDGIGVIDVAADASGNPGLLSPSAIDDLVETIHQRSWGQSKQATGAAPDLLLILEMAVYNRRNGLCPVDRNSLACEIPCDRQDAR